MAGESNTSYITDGHNRKSKERGAAMEIRVARDEGIVDEHIGNLEEMVERIKAIEDTNESLEDQIAATLNEMKRNMQELHGIVRDEVQLALGDIMARLEAMEGRTALFERAMANGERGGATPPRIDVTKPAPFKGSRNAREVDDFLWSMERYFAAANVRDDALKLQTAPSYFADVALLWWRRRETDIARGTCRMETWEDFKAEFKRQFYPENVEFEARARLKQLTHSKTIKEYVREFQEIMLELPSLTDQEALFAFIDGLKPWAKLEVQRTNARNVSEAIAVADRLVELRLSSDKPKFRKEEKGKGGGDRPHKTGTANHGSGKQGDGSGKPRTCHICNATNHLKFNCPFREKNVATVTGETEESEGDEPHVGSLRLLNAVKAHLGSTKGPKRGSMYVDALIGKKTVKALVDTGATHNFMRE